MLILRLSCLAVLLVGAPYGAAAAAATPAPAIVPAPAVMTPKPGAFALTAATRIQASPTLRDMAERLRDDLRPATGLPLPIVPAAAGSRIVLALDPRLARLGDEGYLLTASPKEVVIRAPKHA